MSNSAARVPESSTGSLSCTSTAARASASGTVSSSTPPSRTEGSGRPPSATGTCPPSRSASAPAKSGSPQTTAVSSPARAVSPVTGSYRSERAGSASPFSPPPSVRVSESTRTARPAETLATLQACAASPRIRSGAARKAVAP